MIFQSPENKLFPEIFHKNVVIYNAHWKVRLQIKKYIFLGFLFEQAVIIKCMSFSNFIYQDLSNILYY